MSGEEKNLKDLSADGVKDTKVKTTTSLSLVEGNFLSYTKTNKLVTALFMVTDIIDRDEPLRNKLRTYGMEVVSDVHHNPIKAQAKIHDIVSFLDIACAVNLISEMNRSILTREFTYLDQSIKEYLDKKQKHLAIDEFFFDEEEPTVEVKRTSSFVAYAGHPATPRPLHNGQPRTRIGVQKGHTLLKALSDKVDVIHKGSVGIIDSISFDVLKNQRREAVVGIIKDNNTGLTIKDIKMAIKDKQIRVLLSVGEKTLQRELIAMVKDGVLKKMGEKRWSKYFMKA